MQKVLDNEGERVVLLTDVDNSVVDVFEFISTKIKNRFGEEVGEELTEVLADVPFLCEKSEEDFVDIEMTSDEWITELTDWAFETLNG